MRASAGTPYASLAMTSSLTFTDSPVAAGATYVYKVRAIDSSSRFSPLSIPDAATTILFSDDPVATAVTAIKAVHITEMRQAVNAIRAAAGIGAMTFTDSNLSGVVVKAVHFQELRDGLTQARSSLALPALTFTDPGAGTIFGFGGPFSPVGASLCPGKTAADIKKGGSVESTIGAPFGMFNNVFCPAPAIGNGTGFGTLGRGIIYGPGQHNMDMSIFKDFKVGGLSEAGMIQFRTEFFNTFNTPQFASQTTTQFSTTITQIGAPTFGQVTATTVSPRIIQFGLKYTF